MSLLMHGSRRTPHLPAPTTPPTLTWTSAPQLIDASSTEYLAFPGAITCPNGDVLVAYRNHTAHLGAGDLVMSRSTDNGVTWSTPAVTIPRTVTHGYGTATFSLIDATTIALVTWMRPLVGGYPLVNATRIFLSTDNGVTWGDPFLVDTADWLTRYNVSESALVYRDEWYYLGMWGESLSNPASYFLAGVVRSADLLTWERVAFFDSGATLGYNEIGVAVIGDRLVALVRNETAYRWSTVSTNGTTWTPLAPQDVNGKAGAPKMSGVTFAGVNIVPLRRPDDNGFMASVDSGGNLSNLGQLNTGGWFIYGQVVQFTPTTGGVAYAIDQGDNLIRWRTFAITPPAP